MTCALLLLLLIAPEPTDTPKAAVERLVAAVHGVELVNAYDQLGDEGRKLLDKELSRSARAFGLDPATTTPRQIIAEFEKRLATDAGKQMVAGFEVTLSEANEVGDKATAKAEVTVAGRRETVTLLFVRKDGLWRVDGVDLSEARSQSNETAAIMTLRNITSAQAQFQACCKADANSNGVGEYGTFGELSGAVVVRGGTKLVPPVLASAFRKVDSGVVTRSGYHFRMFLCDANGSGISEEKGTKDIDAAMAETTWCCYAWPVEYGKTGKRSFFVNQLGDVLELDHAAYSGKSGPAASAAFKDETVSGRITGATAINASGGDGKTWQWVR